MLWIDADASFEVSIARTPHEVFSFITDVAHTASYFPGMQRIEALSAELFHFELADRRALGQTLKGEFTARYVKTGPARLEWSTVEGNMKSAGQWWVERRQEHARLHVQMRTGFDLSAPSLLKTPITFFARFETQRCLESQLLAVARVLEARASSREQDLDAKRRPEAESPGKLYT
jgi:carbon monoxide dehydrogenase subunit G